jgi:hypothetical protein
MIKLRNLICEIIAERMSYAELMKASDPERADRASRIPSKSLVVRSLNDREAWKFSYKTPRDENTTGLRHQGFIYFFKEGITPGDNAMTLDCSTDCDCADYKYRWAANNYRAGAGEIGANSLNKNNGTTPRTGNSPGLCKHLLSLKAYLQTEIEGEPTSPEEPVQGEKPVVIPKSPDPNVMPPEEPEPIEPEDPTQTPEPDKEKELQAEPTEPDVDPTQTPQGPEEPEGQPTEEPEDENPEKKKLKEVSVDKGRISKILDNICKTKPIFVIK